MEYDRKPKLEAIVASGDWEIVRADWVDPERILGEG
jgi:hypothetical protein